MIYRTVLPSYNSSIPIVKMCSVRVILMRAWEQYARRTISKDTLVAKIIHAIVEVNN